MSRWKSDELAEPCRYQEPTDSLPLWLHVLILVVLMGFLWVVLQFLEAFEPVRAVSQ